MPEKDCWQCVMDDMTTRRLIGIRRYGIGVHPGDKERDWLLEAYEEALDMVVYLKAELMRRKRDGKEGKTKE